MDEKIFRILTIFSGDYSVHVFRGPERSEEHSLSFFCLVKILTIF